VMSQYNAPSLIIDNKPNLENETDPHTPIEKPRSRFEQFQTPLQSPMIQIQEESHEESPSAISDILPSNSSTTSRRYSAMLQQSPRIPLYGLDNNSASSLTLPGGNVPGNRSSMSSLKYVPLPTPPVRDRSPPRNRSPVRNLNNVNRNRSPSPRKFSPFNFQSTSLADGAAPLNLNTNRASHRKGHRYKHSSVSMNIIPEPKIRAPLKVQASYPIPTIKEFFGSSTRDQKFKLSWSLFHLLTSIVTFFLGIKFSLHSFATLSHLMFYDSLASLVIVFVDIMTNFDVWNKSSIKFPFGLGRIEVLFGFGLSISLVFVGCDLLNHFLEEFMGSLITNGTESHQHSGGHHVDHNESPIGILTYELIIFLTILTTTISSSVIVNPNRKGKISSFFKTAAVDKPTHLITLVYSFYLSLYPLILNFKSDLLINEISTLAISIFICFMGWKVVKYLGYIVLLSFPGSGYKTNSISSKIKLKVQELDEFKSSYSITNLIISKVHMNLILVICNIKMVGGSDETEVNLRLKIHDIIKDSFRDVMIESTIDINRI
ncbi:hypothetical protein WICMUC_004940, partial [Wickerhamomyces mucosus]